MVLCCHKFSVMFLAHHCLPNSQQLEIVKKKAKSRFSGKLIHGLRQCWLDRHSHISLFYVFICIYFSVKVSPLASSPSQSLGSRSSSRSPIRYVQDDTLLNGKSPNVSPFKDSSDDEEQPPQPPPQPAASNAKKRKAPGTPTSTASSGILLKNKSSF